MSNMVKVKLTSRTYLSYKGDNRYLEFAVSSPTYDMDSPPVENLTIFLSDGNEHKCEQIYYDLENKIYTAYNEHTSFYIEDFYLQLKSWLRFGWEQFSGITVTEYEDKFRKELGDWINFIPEDE